ncbi:MAG: pyridoxal phosphate-dependent aminotransferase [Muribaculaceae bacterium]|nr:pyridoxal phosphate-dependent aminotransferase [Muribaculaceae bacterium]
MTQISQRVENLSASATLTMLQKTNELRAAGIDIIGMSAGEPDFNTPEHIKRAACEAIAQNYSRYSAVAGYESLRKAICGKLLSENGLDYTPNQIVVGNGAKQELANTLLATVNPGDEVIIPTPAWVSYVEMVKLAEGNPVLVPGNPENNFKITPSQLEDAITPRTKVLMLNSPCNPTGCVYSRDELTALAEVLRRYPDILILSDEIYEHINYVGGVSSIASCPGMKDRTVIINGVSKAYAMTGWRIGFLAAPIALAKAVTKLQGQYTSGASSIAQKAAEAAYLGSQECVEEMRLAFQRRRDLICSLADEISGWKTSRPDGAFYIFPNVAALIGKHCGSRVISSAGDYVMYLLEEANVACVDGAAFCADGFIRLSYATSDDNIREAMRRIREATLRLSD